MKKIKEGSCDKDRNCVCHHDFIGTEASSCSCCRPKPSRDCACSVDGVRAWGTDATHSEYECTKGNMTIAKAGKPSKSKESWEEIGILVARFIQDKPSFRKLPEKDYQALKTFLSGLLLKQREEDIQKIRKEFVLNYDKLTLKQFDDILKGLKKE